jgi:hypothetical protein
MKIGIDVPVRLLRHALRFAEEVATLDRVSWHLAKGGPTGS